jgi:hypothetical protein
MAKFLIRLLWVAPLLAIGCADADRGVDAASAGLTAGGTDGGESSAGSDTSAGSSDDTGVSFDVADGETGPGDEQQGCDKVDFLFVIDNSSSMLPAQERLIASFPGFIAAIQAYEKTSDFHVMVVDSDEELNQCETWCLAGQPLADDKCGDHVCGTHQAQGACAQTLGGGTRYPVGGGASNVECGLPGDQLYMEASQPDVGGTFACMAQVGNWGYWDELPATAMLESVTTQVQAGACNDGFLRDDAILVVTLVTNANNNTSQEHNLEEPGDWYDGLVAAKGGDADAIVTISFSAVGNGYLDKYAQFTELFGAKGFVGSMDLDDFGPTFADAVGTIQQTCDDFVPPQG